MDKQLQQRLVGAAVIVALVVIFVPELVKQPVPEPQVEPLPAQPSVEEPSTRITLDQPPAVADEPGSVFDEPPAANPEVADDTVFMPRESPTFEAADLPEAPPDIVEAAPPETVPEPLPDDTVSDTVEDEPPSVEPPRQVATRPEPPARSQPPPSARARDTRTRERLPEAPPRRQEPPRVATANRPQPDLPKLELIAKPMAEYQQQQQPRWMVQAGSFRDRDNADSLRNRLRAQQFPAALYPATVDGQTMYRVQVGPHSSRAESERTRDRLQRETGISGSVVPVYN